MSKKYKYEIHNKPNDEVFYRTCTLLEKYMPTLKREFFFIDFDGTFIQVFDFNEKKITVRNIYEYDFGVEINSDIDLSDFLEYVKNNSDSEVDVSAFIEQTKNFINKERESHETN